MSQVMPETGVVSTDDNAWPELYHQTARTMLAHRGAPILMRDVCVMFLAGAGFCHRPAIAPSG
jgi:hypothetical protein